jgi:DHA1 family quinolone resistance protein-like MFS transporter
MEQRTDKSFLLVKKINPVIKFLTISDIMVMGGFGFITPIFAVFITGQISDGTVEVVGMAEGIYMFTRSIMQIPFGYIIDKIKGEKDDFWVMFIGTLLLAAVPILYIFCKNSIQLYIIQFIYGLVGAATFPTWLAIFTRHIDRNREGLEWGIYQTLSGVSAAVFSALGGFVAFKYGFTSLFATVSVFCFIGGLFLIGLYRHMVRGRVLWK